MSLSNIVFIICSTAMFPVRPEGKTSQMSDDHVPAVWRLDKELGIRMSCDITQNKKKNVQMSAQVPKGKQYVKNPETCRNVTRAQPRIYVTRTE